MIEAQREQDTDGVWGERKRDSLPLEELWTQVAGGRGRDFLQCSPTMGADRALGRALIPFLSFSTLPLLPQIGEATGPQLVIRSWSVRAFVSPSDNSRAGQGAYKSSLTLPALCYLRGKITFLCVEARCQESSEQDRGRQSCCLTPVSERAGRQWGMVLKGELGYKYKSSHFSIK